MKAFIALFALVAFVAAEADPGFFYAGYPATYSYGMPHVSYAVPHQYKTAAYSGHFNFPAQGKSAPCVNDLNQAVPCADHEVVSTIHHPGFHYLHKREAEADPAYFAIPHPVRSYAAFNPYTGLHHAHTGYAHSLVHTSHFGVCTNYLGAQVPC